MIGRKPLHQKGFTIIELMIATAVLSTILVLVTVLMINIGNLYYKGINQARVQDNVRQLSDDIGQHLQLGDYFNHATSTSDPNQQVYCIGASRYTYVVGVQIGQPAPGTGAPAYQHVLWRDDNPAPNTCSISAAGGDNSNVVDLTHSNPDDVAEATLGRKLHGAELITPHSRLSNFSIQASSGGSPYTIGVGVAYGDNDLLCAPGLTMPSTGQPTCNVSDPMPTLSPYYTSGNLLCKGSIGDQFCSTARLTTSVEQRLP